MTHDPAIEPLEIPTSWDDFPADWMTAALADDFPRSRVGMVSILLRDDGINRRARLGLEYVSVRVRSGWMLHRRRRCEDAHGVRPSITSVASSARASSVIS